MPVRPGAQTDEWGQGRQGMPTPLKEISSAPGALNGPGVRGRRVAASRPQAGPAATRRARACSPPRTACRASCERRPHPGWSSACSGTVGTSHAARPAERRRSTTARRRGARDRRAGRPPVRWPTEPRWLRDRRGRVGEQPRLTQVVGAQCGTHGGDAAGQPVGASGFGPLSGFRLLLCQPPALGQGTRQVRPTGELVGSTGAFGH
jgi:hypothetical protein